VLCRANSSGGFCQQGLGSRQIQLDELLHAFKGLASQAEEGFDIGFVGGQNLFSGQHTVLLKKG
jgi:hypothetical protein